KGCKSECPSNVDVAKLKAEFLQQYHDANGISFRSWMIGHFTMASAINSNWPGLANFVMSNSVTGKLLKKILGVAQERPLPLLSSITLNSWAKKHLASLQPGINKKAKVYLFSDEYTNYNESDMGVKVIKLLTGLGYEVEIPHHLESARTFISKGLLR